MIGSQERDYLLNEQLFFLNKDLETSRILRRIYIAMNIYLKREIKERKILNKI